MITFQGVFTDCQQNMNFSVGEEKSAPERSRTPNLLIRSQALYPVELRALIKRSIKQIYLKVAGKLPKENLFAR
tara:strand:+ start:276 stop:497 length:222 start_codon:yes stop_codon:yes gene_type:complete